MGGGSAAFDQDRFRFRKDDGSLSAASWWDALNTNIKAAVGENIRCRIAVQETAGVRATNQWFYLYYSINGGAYTVGTPGSYYASPYFADEERDDVQRLGTGQTFTGGGANDSGIIGNGDWIDFGGSDEWELEFCFRVPTSCVYGDTVDFRLYRYNGSAYVALNTYTNTPRVTVAGSAKSSTPALALGGGYPKGSVPAYLTGDFPRSKVHAYAEGYRDGYSAKHAWMKGVPSKVPAYTYGIGGIKVAVVPFTARTNTGTTDITSTKLAGTSCKLAMFFGVGASTFDSATANARIFFGATDGTRQFLRYGYCLDGSGSSSTQGGDYTTYCAGFVSSSGGSAAFDSWLTGSAPGVRINWSAGAPAAYKCCAILIGAPTDEAFQAYVGTWQTDATPTAGEQIYKNVGFKPKTVLFSRGVMSSIQQGLGIATWDDSGTLKQRCRGTSWDTGYFNDCGSYDETTMIQGYRLGVNEWGMVSRDDQGFTLECQTTDDTYHGGGFIAMRFVDDFEVNFVDLYVNSTGSKTANTKNKPQAVLAMFAPTGYTNTPYCTHCHYVGYAAFDDTYQIAGSINHASLGSSQDVASYATEGADCSLYYDHTIEHHATRTSINSNGFTLNYDIFQTRNISGKNYFAIVFGGGRKERSKQKAYMLGHWRRVHAYTRGQIHAKSSKPAFYWVVDAQSSVHAYTEGLQPSRSSAKAYLMGTSSVNVVVVPFTTTATSTQDITSLELAGATPKGAVCVIFYSPGDDTWSEGSQGFGHGFTDGTHSWYECIYTYNDASEPYGYGVRRGYDVGFICLTNSSASVSLKGTFNSFITNGIRVNWTTQAAGRKGVMILFAGTDLNAKVGKILPTANGTTATTEPGFTPDLLFFGHQRAPATEFSEVGAWDTGDGIGMGYAVNDGYRMAMNWNGWVYGGNSYVGPCISPDSMGCYVQTGALVGGYQEGDYPNNSTLTIESFDVSGFTVRAGPNYYGSSTESAYLALSFGGKLKAKIDYIHPTTSHTSGIHTYKLQIPNRNLLPIFSWIFAGHNYVTASYTVNGIPYKNGATWSGIAASAGACDINGPAFAIASQSQRWGFSAQSGAWFWDCLWSQWSDVRAGSSFNVTYPIRSYYTTEDTHLWYEHIRAKIASFILNGIQLEWFLNQNKYFPSQLVYDWPILIIGMPEEKSKCPAYMKGQKVDWRGRTPRGCYCEGVLQGTETKSSAKAYLYGQVNAASSVHVYLEGFVTGASAVPAYTRGTLDDKSSQPAYMLGSIDEKSSNDAYMLGSIDVNGKQKAFLKGATNETSSANAYLSGGLGASSSAHAFTSSGWDVKSSQPAYIWCDYSRSSAHAYLEGAAAYPVSVKPAFMMGGGVFPFTDDFTGSDGSTWNNFKWETSEQ